MSLPTTQKALFLLAPRGDWAVGPHPVPTPAKGEVIVRIEGSALNPVDWKIHDFDFGVPEYPTILGTDSAGVVVAVGEGVDEKKVKVGDRVIHQGLRNKRQAAFQQYTAASADLVAKIPSTLSFDQGSSLLAVATAAVGLYAPKVASGGAALTPPWKSDGRGKYAGQPILVIGGSSAVGQAAIQFAALSGFNPIITTVSPRNFDLVTSLGATHPIDRNLPLSTLPSAVGAITTQPIKVIYDAISLPDTQNASYKILASGGILILVLASAIKDEDKVKGKEVVNPFGSAPNQGAFGRALYEHFAEYIEKGELKPNQVEYIPGGLASIPDALDRLRKGQVSGEKLIVRPQETS